MSFDLIKKNLEAYKRSFYKKRLLKGLAITLVIFISFFVLTNILESTFWFSSTVRFVLFVCILLAFLIPLYSFILIPLLELFKIRRGVSDEHFARDIGNNFPEISDKLLNIIQLQSSQDTTIELATAAITQKSIGVSKYDFASSIKFLDVRRYFLILLLLIGVVTSLSFIDKGLVFESGTRIVKFTEEFERPAPFTFQLANSSFSIFKNEDFILTGEVIGNSLPDQIKIISGSRVFPVKAGKQFEYHFENVQESFTFQLEGSGFRSKTYKVIVNDRPEIKGLSLKLDYPKHTRLKDEVILNGGNAVVPEGTSINWSITSKHTDSIFLLFDEKPVLFKRLSEQEFVSSRVVFSDLPYEIKLANQFGGNKARIAYQISVIKDRHPSIEVFYQPDSTYFRSVLITGSVSDDYGFNNLILNCKVGSQTKTTKLKLNEFPSNQPFAYEFRVDSLLFQNESLELWVDVYDNDVINGYKKQSSNHFTFSRPDKKDLEKMIDKSTLATEKSLSGSKKKSDDINSRLKQLEERLKNQTTTGWQEEKLINDLMAEKQKLQDELSKLEDEFKNLVESQKEFLNLDEKVNQKSESLQKMIDQLRDNETMKLFEELQKLMQEKADNQKLMEKLSQIRPKEKNLEKELERTLELFKRLKLETEINKTANDLEKLGEEQEGLSKEENDQAKQEKINEDFKDLEKSLEEIEKLNQDLKKPEALEDFGDFADEIKKEQEEISQDMKNGSTNSTNQKQKNAGAKMKQMASKMKQMQSVLEMEAMQENIEQLRDILDNLIKLSFEEERIFTEIRNLDQTDPRYLTLSQNQLSLIDNSKVIEDSLLALASRVLQISSYITKEISAIQEHLKVSMDKLKDRQKNVATTHQQFAMASMNNLALLLDNTLQQMQMSMSEAMGTPKKGQGNKPQSKPSDLQQQLGEKIEQLKKSGASGRELSEQLAKLAAEQAMIRQMLEEQEKRKSDLDGKDAEGGSGLKEIIEKMEQNEIDLVNKRLTQNLINRQQDIITRMLESDKSEREQEESPERESESARQQKREYLSPAFEEYLRNRKKEIELLNTIPLELSPFYKKEVNDYFRRLSSAEK